MSELQNYLKSEQPITPSNDLTNPEVVSDYLASLIDSAEIIPDAELNELLGRFLSSCEQPNRYPQRSEIWLDETDAQPNRDLHLLSDELAIDPEIQKLFGLKRDIITKSLQKVVFNESGFQLSPTFQSPGWEKVAREPTIRLSSLVNSSDVVKHELKHGLHFAVCQPFYCQHQS